MGLAERFYITQARKLSGITFIIYRVQKLNIQKNNNAN